MLLACNPGALDLTHCNVSERINSVLDRPMNKLAFQHECQRCRGLFGPTIINVKQYEFTCILNSTLAVRNQTTLAPLTLQG